MEIEEKKAEAKQTLWGEEEEGGGGTLYFFAFIVSDLNLADGERAAYIKRVVSLCALQLTTQNKWKTLFPFSSITRQQQGSTRADRFFSSD